MDIQTDKEKNIRTYTALHEIDEKEHAIQSREKYFHAYVMSVLFAPLGIYYWAKYVFFSNGSREEIQAGFISLFLTIASLLISMWAVGIAFKQLVPTNSSEDFQLLQNLTSPSNVKEIIKLYQ